MEKNIFSFGSQKEDLPLLLLYSYQGIIDQGFLQRDLLEIPESPPFPSDREKWPPPEEIKLGSVMNGQVGILRKQEKGIETQDDQWP